MSLTLPAIYALAGCGLFAIGLYALVMQPDLLRKILALNVGGSGVFLLLVAVAHRGPGPRADPVPHAMVLTGIVVAVCVTAVALVLTGRVQALTDHAKPEAPPPGDARDT